MRISDWSSDVCSSDLCYDMSEALMTRTRICAVKEAVSPERPGQRFHDFVAILERMFAHQDGVTVASSLRVPDKDTGRLREHDVVIIRSEEHTSELQSLMRISYAVLCLKKKKS